MKTQQYAVLANPSPVALAEQVNKAIARGWQPVGSVVVYPETPTEHQSLLQTVVRPADLADQVVTPDAQDLDAASVAETVHYPGCWDTAAYPTLAAALHELAAAFRCSNADCPAVPAPKLPDPGQSEPLGAHEVHWLWTYQRSPCLHRPGTVVDTATGKCTLCGRGPEPERRSFYSGKAWYLDAERWVQAREGELGWVSGSLEPQVVRPGDTLDPSIERVRIPCED